MSNDGWFRFSQQIDQHLATHVFRAVENNMWYVTATNGGYSAVISPKGKIVKIGNRGTAEAVTEVMMIPVTKPWFTRLTGFQRYGDWYALAFAVITAVAALPFRRIAHTFGVAAK
jgi:apolipoprotein N-acyltransferase